MVHLSVSDPGDLIASKNMLPEGCPIRVLVQSGDNLSETKVYHFRLNKHRKMNAAPSTVYEMDGYFDSTKYWLETAVSPREGSSFSVLGSIAAYCGLSFQGEPTADDQVWWPSNKKFFVWSQDISRHGFKSPSSLMKLGLDLNRVLIYKDVSVLVEPKHRVSIGVQSKGAITAFDFRPTSDGGTNNNRHGYKSAMVYQKPVGGPSGFPAVLDDKVTVSMNPVEISLNRNPNVSSSIERGNVRFGPLDFGNVHPNYLESKYRGDRLNSLFSLGFSFVTTDTTNIQILDTVSVSIDSSDSLPNQENFSGLYVVVGRCVYIHASNYYERVDLVRRSHTTEMTSS